MAIVGLVLVVVIGVILLFVYGSRERSIKFSGEINFWGVFETPEAINTLISAYRAQRPSVTVNYREVNPASYESEFVNALASGNAPDVVMFHSSWLPEHNNKILPFGSEAINIDTYRQLFPVVAEQDFAPDGLVYAFPLFIDTLALYYNRDLFDNAGVALSPTTWEEFEKLIPKLRKLDKLGRIQKPAAAIGGSNRSINRATDLLGLLMLQTGTEMVNSNFTRATFDSAQGLNGLNFYTKFANPVSPAFTWSDSLPYSLDNFSEGNTAMMFNYAYQAGALKEKNPFLNFRIAPMLQPENRSQDVNYANYWGLAVTVGAKNKSAARDFAQLVTTDPTIAEAYLVASGRPPALRSLIAKYLNHPDLGLFARQALTARSWPQADSSEVEKAMSEMVESVLAGRFAPKRALEEAAGKVTRLMEQVRK